MQIGIFGDTGVSSLAAVVDAVREAAEHGLSSYWLPQVFGIDAMMAAAVAGHEVGDIELGTSVVPIYPRHPIALAAEASTAQMATGGRFTLGVGLSHQFVIESMYGYSFDKPASYMEEYLAALLPLLRGEAVDLHGRAITCVGRLKPVADPSPGVVVAALGERMLRLAGSLTDGTVTWMTGANTLAGHIVPTLRAAAESAGRPAPRVVVGLPVCVTSDESAGRDRAARLFGGYGQLPSYRAMLDREGAAGPADISLVGDESTVRGEIERLAESGATDFLAAEFGEDHECARTRELLRSMVPS